jgi:hypothetical protein
MAKKKPYVAPTPEEIVAAWHKEVKKSLKPWFLTDETFADLEPKLIKNITELMKTTPFTRADMVHSLRVARDTAKICKILRPKALARLFKAKRENIYEIGLDTYEIVLDLAATQHQVCQPVGGSGGWCDIGG